MGNEKELRGRIDDLEKELEELRGENEELKEGLREMARHILRARAPLWKNPLGISLAQLVEERVDGEIEEITEISI